MTSVLDLWRAVDPDARLLGGTENALRAAVRGVQRTRAAPPHLPEPVQGALLVADAALVVGASVEPLLAGIREAGLAPPGIVVGNVQRPFEAAHGEPPVIASGRAPAALSDAALAYLADEAAHLERLALSTRLTAAEAALADPSIAAAAGSVAERMRRGVAVSVAGRLESLNPRSAGRALAARFAADHARLRRRDRRGGRVPPPARRPVGAPAADPRRGGGLALRRRPLRSRRRGRSRGAGDHTPRPPAPARSAIHGACRCSGAATAAAHRRPARSHAARRGPGEWPGRAGGA
jgi:hypothetical protein